jgi:hypothetical protein
MNKVILMSILFLSMHLSAQEMNRFGFLMESQIMQVTSSLNFKRLGLNGTLGIDYKVANRLYAGGYFTRMLDISQNENPYYLIQGKVVDVSSTVFINFGTYVGYKLYSEDKFSIIPELRLGYGIFRAKTAYYVINNAENNEVKVSMLTVAPRLLASYQLAKPISAGISAGYLLPIYTEGVQLREYDMQNINIGLFLKLHLK